MTAARRPSGIGTAARFGVGVAGPLTLFAAIYVLWWASDRLEHIGPLDKASFFWVVLWPIWCLSPALAALLWRRLDPGSRRLGAGLVALALALTAASILWLAGTADQASCEFGPRTTAAGLIAPMALIGIVIGAGWAGCALAAAATIGSGRVGRGIALGFGLAVAHFFVVVVAAGLVIMTTGGCNRPA